MATTSAFLEEAARALWAQQTFSFHPDRQLPEPRDEPRRERDGPRVIFTGFPSDYSLAFLYALLDLDVEPVGIITSPGAHPAILGTNALSRIADHLGIPLLRLWRVNDEHARLDIAALHPDAAVMASFDQIIGARALAIPVHGWLNIHPSPLPLYRGPEPIYWTIAEGAPEAGITLHRAVPRFDSGPILAQARLPVRADDTAGTLTRRLAEAGAALLGTALDRLIADDPGQAFDPESGSYRPSVGHRRLDSAGSAVEAERMVRAGMPNMPAWTVIDGRPAYAHAARISADCDEAPGVRFPDGCLELLETAPACGCHHDRPDCPHREGAA